MARRETLGSGATSMTAGGVKRLVEEYKGRNNAWQGAGRIARQCMPAAISARTWTEKDGKPYLFKGLSLFAMDGAMLKTSDRPAP
ncbi:MAG: hypothetical protein ACJ8G3_19715 [Burkholderiaceae bacterium]